MAVGVDAVYQKVLALAPAFAIAFIPVTCVNLAMESPKPFGLLSLI